MTLRALTQILLTVGIKDAAFEAGELACAATGRSLASVMTDDFDETAVMPLAKRRIGGEPLQYILGLWEFMGCPFKVTPDCLIPRADTEILAQFLIDAIPRGGRFADLCTGSGCIAVSALCHRKDITGIAVELYENTLSIAKENAEKNGVLDRLEFIHADVTSDCLGSEKYDVIVSNPPYVTAGEMKELDREVLCEPYYALTDGGDGLSIIRRIIELYPAHLKECGVLAIEIGWKQGAAVQRIAEKNGLVSNIIKDTADRDRVVCIRRADKYFKA